MDDDVKNLYQKFGKSGDDYQEINRIADGEQARQRWPLLRDVNVHSIQHPPKRNRPIAPRIHAEMVQVARSRELAGIEAQKQIETFESVQSTSTAQSEAVELAAPNIPTAVFTNIQSANTHTVSGIPQTVVDKGTDEVFLNKLLHPTGVSAGNSAHSDGGRRESSSTSAPDTSINSLFNRLAGKQTPSTPVQGNASFFTKIFKS